MKYLHYAAYAYFKVIDIFHLPFVKRGDKDPFHRVFKEFSEIVEQSESTSILEVGSRNVSGITRRELFPACTEYVGFDVLDGDGVDIVGDVHKLSDYCSEERFDFVYSISVFEHLLFPWKAVLEINKVLKPGGYVFLSTHPAWPAHELPWDFWRFPGGGFHGLFNKYTGFEIVAVNEGLPAKIYSLVDDKPTRRMYTQSVNQGVSLLARKTGNYRSDLSKWDVDVSEVIDTMYPEKSRQTTGRYSLHPSGQVQVQGHSTASMRHL